MTEHWLTRVTLNRRTPRALPCSEMTTDVTACCLDNHSSLNTLPSSPATSLGFSSWTDVTFTRNVFASCGSVLWQHHWIGLSSQHSIGYMGDGTGQKTQPIVSKYWRKKATKENPEKAKSTKYAYTYKIVHNKEIHI